MIPKQSIDDPRAGSWIVVHKETGEAVLETFEIEIAKAINTKAYYVFTAMDYLCQLNAKIKSDNEKD